MREIKFRAWDKKNKKMCFVWAVGYYKNGTIADIKIQQGNKWKNIKNFILLQYTGLRDVNGKEIYEGDIVRGITYKEVIACKTKAYCIGVVEIKPDTLWVEWKLPNGFRTLPDLSSKDIEVIGNIYENPELLEEGE